ncbi:hypothetical protein C0992_011243 [Termitomyces sp. T32_za158]|nr:hypothetical protein C0992_011243 [Termitomyces sp. T32_za158]
MSTTTRRKGKARYEKDDLLDPPAKVVKAARRRGSALRLVNGLSQFLPGVQSNAKFITGRVSFDKIPAPGQETKQHKRPMKDGLKTSEMIQMPSQLLIYQERAKA